MLNTLLILLHIWEQTLAHLSVKLSGKFWIVKLSMNTMDKRTNRKIEFPQTLHKKAPWKLF